ncbi:MAG: hypothetical protein Q8L85_00165 [Alphaproteobacteria bacterium]|nr:hypothetical protein [Alphaproteobacteria bacterium]
MKIEQHTDPVERILPFKYKAFATKDKNLEPGAKVVNVYQQTYFILEASNTNFDYAFLGPLSPCIGIIVRDPLTSTILVAHKDLYIGISSIEASIRALNNINNLNVHLFTCSMGERYDKS